MNIILILLGKIFSFLINSFSLGRGSTWPGHVALSVNENFSREVLRNSKTKIVLIAGTNGKTTTSKLIKTILEENGKRVLHNKAGANLENGLASTLIEGSNLLGKINYDFLIFESDEYTLPLILKKITSDYLILLNLFRDQLDRYGEIDSIAKRWKESIGRLRKITLILNADDPQIAYMAKNTNLTTHYFGLDNYRERMKELPHGADSVYCPNCNHELSFDFVNFSHLGGWKCNYCKFQRPKPDISTYTFFPLVGAYNSYNTLASILFTKIVGLKDENILKTLKNFKPAFGRQEKIVINGKSVQLFLSKNPTSFNESLRTISQLNAKKVLIILNDRIPDGRDISWIWDVNLKPLKMFKKVFLSGDRVYDLALRTKYEDIENFQTFEDLKKGIYAGLKKTDKNETLYVLPTYSAMLETREVLLGKKLL